MNQLPKLVAHCTWANRAWLQFIVDKAASDDWLLRRLSHILLGERAWFQRIHGQEPGRDSGLCSPVLQLEQLSAEHERIFAELLDGELEALCRSSDSQVRGTSLRSEISSFTWRFTGLTIVADGDSLVSDRDRTHQH